MRVVVLLINITSSLRVYNSRGFTPERKFSVDCYIFLLQPQVFFEVESFPNLLIFSCSHYEKSDSNIK